MQSLHMHSQSLLRHIHFFFFFFLIGVTVAGPAMHFSWHPST